MKIQTISTALILVGSALVATSALALQNTISVNQSESFVLAKAENEKSKHPLSDTAITAKVKEKFIQEKFFDKKNVKPMSVHVKTINGIVYLTGKVRTKEQADNAVSIAQSVSGVKEVKSKIKVKDMKEMKETKEKAEKEEKSK